MRHQGGIDDPGVCDCGHYAHLHPCKGRGAWKNPKKPKPLIWINKHTAIQILQHCLCEEVR